MRIVLCRCGEAFETESPNKIYCSSECQIKFSKQASWERVKSDYRFRCKNLLHMAKYRAKTQNLYFDLDLDYLINLWEEQEGRCSLSGRLLDLSRPSENNTVNPNAPSLDRIIPNKGYTKENVRFVCYQVNTALNQYGEEALISLCKDIISFQGGVA